MTNIAGIEIPSTDPTFLAVAGVQVRLHWSEKGMSTYSKTASLSSQPMSDLAF
jgi:hypothetical protein